MTEDDKKRRCGNCAHYYISADIAGYGSCANVSSDYHYDLTDEDFACNKWESKQKGSGDCSHA